MIFRVIPQTSRLVLLIVCVCDQIRDSCGADMLAGKRTSSPLSQENFFINDAILRNKKKLKNKKILSSPWQYFPFYFSNQSYKIVAPSSLILSLPAFQFSWSVTDL